MGKQLKDKNNKIQKNKQKYVIIHPIKCSTLYFIIYSNKLIISFLITLILPIYYFYLNINIISR